MSAPKFPKSILYYVPFTITNNASVATPAPFQQMVVVNPSLYISYLASDLSNVQWYDSSGNVINSWLESGNSNTGTKAVYWLSLANGIAADSSITVYMGIASTTTNMLNNTTTGEAPQLSPTYGQYDNGASVFTQYGGGGSTGWSKFTYVGGTWTTANGYLQQTSTSGSYAGGPAALIESTSYPNNGYYILGMAFNYTTNANARVGIIAVATPTSTPDVLGYRFIGMQENGGAGFISFLSDQSAWVVNNTYQGSVSTPYTMIITNAGATWSGGLYSGYGTETSTPLTSLGATSWNYPNGAGATSGYVGISAASVGASNPINVMWFYMRAYPPNGVMPAISAGSIANVVILIPGVTVTAIPSLPQYKTVSGVTDSNGNVSLEFALNVPYTLKFSGAAVGTVNNFSPGNDTITFYRLTNSSSSSISVGGQAVASGASVYLIPGQIPISTSFANFKSWSPGIYFANQSSKSTTLNMPNVDISINITTLGYYAYVANEGSSTVSVIDTGTNAVVATISVGSDPVGVAITPDGNYAYVVNFGPNTVSVIDTSTNAVVATISVGSGPYGVAITPDGSYAYVANSSSNTVSVIDTGTNAVVATITVGFDPVGVAITPDGNYAYVTNYDYPGIVSVIDTGTNAVVATISVASDPYGVAITPDGNYAYVTLIDLGTVSVIDTSTNAVVATITVGSGPYGVAITPDGNYAYVTNYGSNTVSVIDTSTNAVVATISVGNGPERVAITPDGNYAYVTNYGSNTVSVIDTSTNAVVATISVGSNPVGVAITP